MFNTDQGRHFRSKEWLGEIESRGGKSVWAAKDAGQTRCLSNASGGVSNMKNLGFGATVVCKSWRLWL